MKTLQSRFVVLSALGVSVLSVACEAARRQDTGATRGHLSEWAGVSLETERWRVGSFDGPEHQVIGKVGGASFDEHGLILSDAIADRVHWYDDAGNHRASAGASGRGPGEFVEPRGVETLPDGNTVVVNIGGGGLEIFGSRGEFVRRLSLPVLPEEICALDSTLVVLGVREGSMAPLHVFDFYDEEPRRSLGSTEVPSEDMTHLSRLLSGLIQGSIACVRETVIYAKSSDGTVSRIGIDGLQLWSASVPQFVPMVHEPGRRGIRHGPAEGAREMHGFAGVWRLGEAVAAQIWRVDVETDDVSLYTVFIDLENGSVLGRDTSLPLILAVNGTRLAVEAQGSVPSVSVVDASYRDVSKPFDQ